MNEKRLDVVDVLKREKEYYVQQIKRINVALSALRGEPPEQEPGTTKRKRTKPIAWTAEIREIFEDGLELNMKELRNRLVERGYVEANEQSGKNSVYSTVSRMISNGHLEKTDTGYRKKQQTLSPIIKLNEENQTE